MILDLNLTDILKFLTYNLVMRMTIKKNKDEDLGIKIQNKNIFIDIYLLLFEYYNFFFDFRIRKFNKIK